MLGKIISKIRLLKTRSCYPRNISVLNICVAIRLAEDRTKMGGIQFQLAPSLIINTIGTNNYGTLNKLYNMVHSMGQ